MTPQCMFAVSQAAGRHLTAAEAKDLEARVVASMRQLARVDREKWQAMSTAQRLSEGAQLAGDQIRAESVLKQQRVVLQAQRQSAIADYITEAGQRGIARLDALRRTLVNVADGKSNTTSAESRINAIHANAMRQLWDTFEATEPRIFGLLANKDGIRALVKELSGEDSGSVIAKKGAEAFQRVSEGLRQRFNAAGGTIGKLDNYRMPQYHSQERVAAAGVDQWVKDTWGLWDRSQYVNPDGTLMNDGQFHDFLTEAGKTIATGGLNKIKPGENRGTGALANRGNESRQLHFKDADSFLAYQEQYGARTIEQAIASHVLGISRDIGMAETYGPNSAHAFRYFLDHSQQETANENPSQTGKVTADAHKLDNLFAYMAGQRDPVASQWLAKRGDDLRQWMIAARLGSSPITALVDEGTLHLTAQVNGLSHMQLLRNELAAFNPANRAEKRMLQRAGLGIEAMTSEINRWGDANLGKSFSSRVAETTMRLSGLDALDSVRRRSLGATMFDAVGSLTREHETLASLDSRDAGLLKSRGITEAEWQVLRRAQTEDWGGGNSHVLSPDAIMRVPDEALADLGGNPQQLRDEALTKYLGLVLDEGNMAVPVPGAAERAIGQGGSARGTLGGELWRSFMLFKSFPMAMIRKHFMQRGLGMEGARSWYIASLMASTTVLGAVSQSINDVLAGKDPQRYLSSEATATELTKNWVAAFLKGGSMGLYGDFLFSSIGKNGQNDMFGTLAGPVLGLTQEAMNVSQGNLIQFAEGKDTHFGPEAVKFAKGLTPGASLWYAKAALDHMIFQQLQDYLQPGYSSRMASRMEHQFATSYWWRPGETQPANRPTLARAIGQQ